MKKTEYNDLVIFTDEKSYAPAEDSFLAAKLLIEYLKAYKEKELEAADIGTGSGILGMVALQSYSVSKVLFSDINEKALADARENVLRNGITQGKECKFIVSDLFKKIEGKFDIILFNAPYLPHEEQFEKMESRAWDGGKEGIELTIRFLNEAAVHLKDSGKIILVASSFGNMERLGKEMEKLKLKVLSYEKEHIFFEDIIAMLISK